MSVKLKWEKEGDRRYRAGEYSIEPGRKPLRGYGSQEYYPYYQGEMIETSGQSLKRAKYSCIVHASNNASNNAS